MKDENKSLLEKFNDFKVENTIPITGGVFYYDDEGNTYDTANSKTVIDCIDDFICGD